MTVVLNAFRAQSAPAVPGASISSMPGNANVAMQFDDVLGVLRSSDDRMTFLGNAVSQRLGDLPGARAGADVFNEHGFFQGPISSGMAGATTPGTIARVSTDDGGRHAPSTNVGPLETVQTPGSGGLAPSEAMDARHATIPSLGSIRTQEAVPPVTFRPVDPGDASGVKFPAFAVHEQDSSIPVQAGSGPRLSAPLVRQILQDTAPLNPTVSVQAVEHGLRVVARLGELNREELIRLRDRIAATLSRHGFVPRTIYLVGQAPIEKDQ